MSHEVMLGKLTREKQTMLTKAPSRIAFRDIGQLINIGVLEQEKMGGSSTSYRLKSADKY